MPDIIALLPDSIANQIAAGEVIQRPASALKELVENAVDAGATHIKVIIKDAGKQLIQVIDNGSGMSDTDARMSFERHATSKLKTADDLFNISTKGFRGEALASIAAIAQVEMKTKLINSKVGSILIVNGSTLELQEPCSCTDGTSIAVKNLFFNTPARRNFLKSNPVETAHIVEEIQRIAFAHPEIAFTYYYNDEEVLNVETGNLRKRIISIYGNSYNEKLVPVEQESSIVNIKGYVLKPEFARKTRGEQYFFLNNRFIKNSYLHHAVQGAFSDLLPVGSHPSYFLHLQVNPNSIDVNIHPTKTEVKFEDEKSIYAILRSSIKQSLGMYNVSPSLSFESESSIDFNSIPKNQMVKIPTVKIDNNYNPFKGNSNNAKLHQHNKFESETGLNQKTSTENTHQFYVDLQNEITNKFPIELPYPPEEKNSFLIENNSFQIGAQFIITKIKSGLVVIDQQAAAERILYERNLKSIAIQSKLSQQLLFPQTFELNSSESLLLKEFLPDLNMVGIELEEFGQNAFVVRGIPSTLHESEIVQTIHYLLENFKQSDTEISLKRNKKIARLLAQNLAMKSRRELSKLEIDNITNDLFACENPFYSPSGKPTLISISLEELLQKFK